MEEIDISIESFLDTIDKTVQNELKFVKSKDWSNMELPKDRNDTHDLQFLLTDRNIKHAVKLNNLAVLCDNPEAPRIKAMMKSLLTFFDLYERRYDHYTGKQDFSKILDGIESTNFNIKAEIEFQSDLAKNLTTFRETVRKIKVADDKTKSPIQVFNDTPIPFLMKDAVERRYPIVKEILTKKNEKS